MSFLPVYPLKIFSHLPSLPQVHISVVSSGCICPAKAAHSFEYAVPPENIEKRSLHLLQKCGRRETMLQFSVHGGAIRVNGAPTHLLSRGMFFSVGVWRRAITWFPTHLALLWPNCHRVRKWGKISSMILQAVIKTCLKHEETWTVRARGLWVHVGCECTCVASTCVLSCWEPVYCWVLVSGS